jgi:hypothetical protein
MGWIAALKWGREAEKGTMSLLTLVWLLTISINLATQSAAPVEMYAALDAAAVVWFWRHQRNNWQWIPAGLATAMLLTHFLFWTGTHSGSITYSGRPYQDILAVLAYLQVAATGWASYERARARHRRWFVRMGHWALATNWLPRRGRHHALHAE